jgi:hypothetical protein
MRCTPSRDNERELILAAILQGFVLRAGQLGLGIAARWGKRECGHHDFSGYFRRTAGGDFGKTRDSRTGRISPVSKLPEGTGTCQFAIAVELVFHMLEERASSARCSTG